MVKLPIFASDNSGTTFWCNYYWNCEHLGVIIGAPLYYIITIEAANIWEMLFLRWRLFIFYLHGGRVPINFFQSSCTLNTAARNKSYSVGSTDITNFLRHVYHSNTVARNKTIYFLRWWYREIGFSWGRVYIELFQSPMQ